jgi:hypothetical protein
MARPSGERLGRDDDLMTVPQKKAAQRTDARGGEDPVVAGLETGADGGTLTCGLHDRRLMCVHIPASALIGGTGSGKTASPKAIC